MALLYYLGNKTNVRAKSYETKRKVVLSDQQGFPINS